jgi:TPR repeat protein
MLSCKDRGEQMLNLGLDCARKGDKDNAVKWFLEAAQYGESKAMNMLGLDCMKECHYDTAEMWFSQGAELGNMVAKYNLAFLYQKKGDMEKENGKVEKGDEDFEIAIRLYREIVPHYPRAKNNLAVILYEQGDKEQALQLWDEAKAEGCSSAIFNVAWLADKRGDIETAKIGYKQSADKGDSDGMFYLAALYEKQEDFLSAKYWYNKAAEKGNKEAELKVKELGSGHLLRRKCKRMLSFYKSP